MNDTDTNTTNNGEANNNNKNDGHLNMFSPCLGKEKPKLVYPVGFYLVEPFRWLNKAVRNESKPELFAARCERGARPAAPSPDGAHRAAPHRPAPRPASLRAPLGTPRGKPAAAGGGYMQTTREGGREEGVHPLPSHRGKVSFAKLSPRR